LGNGGTVLQESFEFNHFIVEDVNLLDRTAVGENQLGLRVIFGKADKAQAVKFNVEIWGDLRKHGWFFSPILF
jgi:hypothetical protein